MILFIALLDHHRIQKQKECHLSLHQLPDIVKKKSSIFCSGFFLWTHSNFSQTQDKMSLSNGEIKWLQLPISEQFCISDASLTQLWCQHLLFCSSRGQPCAKTLVSNEAISPDFMDAKERNLFYPHFFTGAGGILAMAQSCEGCQRHQHRG